MAFRSKLENREQASSHYFLGKKPVASASLFLVAAANNQKEKVDTLPASKEHWAEYERLRDLIRRIRRSAGFSPWFPIGACTASCILLILAVSHYASRTQRYTWPDHTLRVVQNLDPCDSVDGSCGKRFIVQSVDFGVPNPETEMHFREVQHFEAGQTFSHISFKYIGSEAVVDAWDVLRDENRKPVLAPNCNPDYSKAPMAGHIACAGGRARF